MNYEDHIVSVVKNTVPAVVSIVASEDLAIIREKGLPFFGGIPIDPEAEEEIIEHLPKTTDGKVKLGGGSGFIIDPNGYILTNKHVVADHAAEYAVVTQDEQHYPAKILARDPLNDVAIIKIEAADLPVLPLGDSTKIMLGQTVVAVGNALGEFKNTVSTGIISGLSRFITAVTDMEGHAERLRGLIQTDAAINPGNSGGPLVNLKGEVIGINSAIVFGAQNIGFAIPINKARVDLEDVKKFGRLKTPYLGVRYILMNADLKEKFGAPSERGALILSSAIGGPTILPGSPAEKAGFREHDIILEMNGTPITEQNSIEDILEKCVVGQRIKTKVLRSGREEIVPVVLGERRES